LILKEDHDDQDIKVESQKKNCKRKCSRIRRRRRRRRRGNDPTENQERDGCILFLRHLYVALFGSRLMMV